MPAPATPTRCTCVRHTLDKMARGGIYDHLGGGFARYSTDERWLVPHFEKMLYDNALLASAYLEAYQATGDAEFGRVARETMDYVLGRMTDPEGAFYSTEDADSEGVEGKYYVWSLAEINEVLGADRGKTFAYVYDVTPSGNWEASEHPQPAQADRAGGEAAGPRGGRAAGRAGRGPRQAAGRARPPRSAGQGHQGPRLVERPDDRGAWPRAAGSSRTSATSTPPAAPPAFILDRMRHSRRPAAPHLQGRPGPARRLSRRLRQPDRRPDPAVRGDRRAALDRVGPGAGAGHDRRVRRPRARRVLLHGPSPRGADRPAEGLHDNATPSGNGMAADGAGAAGRLDRPRRPDAGAAARRSSRCSSCWRASRPRPARA